MIEDTILSNLVGNETYLRKVISFLTPEYFSENIHKAVFKVIDDFVVKYNRPPSPEALRVELASLGTFNEQTYYEVSEYVSKLRIDPATDPQWLIDQTEKFCQDKALYNALLESVSIADGNDKNISRGAIPKMMADALSVSFDNSVGHDYFDDFEARYEFYHTKEEKIPFDLHYLNEITKGGIARKTLTILMAGTGVGKSLSMCSFAAANLLKGKNVLYITLEMSEERIAERIDMNLLNLTTEEMGLMSRDMFKKRVSSLRDRTIGRLKVKEYPTSTAGSATFRALLNELKTKQNFVPDIIYIDYLNICMSSRVKMSGSINSYTYIKMIAEELRGLAVEFNVPVVSATQVNRTGFTSSDIGLEDTSESFGLPATADLFLALIADEELEQQNQIVIKQLKNRYADIARFRRFIVGIDRAHMRLFDAEDSAQKDLMDGPKIGTPVFDSTPSGEKFSKNKFKDLS